MTLVVGIILVVSMSGGHVHGNCSNGDEDDGCGNATCPQGFWRCTDGQCVAMDTRCDNGTTGAAPCVDGSDEEGCENFTCPAPRVATANGFCIKKNLHVHCDFNDNVTNGFSPSKPCPDCQFVCNNGQRIGFGDRCNGYVDCLDSTDEESCENNICPARTFRCSNGQCLLSYKSRCDGIRYSCFDCVDGSDEYRCALNRCPFGQYRCRSGQCLEKDICNADLGACDATTDPTDHCYSNRCPKGYFRCADGRCLHHISRCDNVTDCENGGDEENCGKPDCRNDQIDCGDGNCLPRALVCDGYPDCSTNVDEVECSVGDKLRCADAFLCKNTTICLATESLCNGSNECIWGEDERSCYTSCPQHCTCVKGSIDCRTSISRLDKDDQFYNSWPFKVFKTSENSQNLFNFDQIFELRLPYSDMEKIPTALFTYVPFLQYCDFSHNKIKSLHQGDFDGLYRLASLNLSYNIITTIQEFALRGLRVALLDLRRNPIKDFNENIFGGIAADGIIHTDNDALCKYRPGHLRHENCFPNMYFRCFSGETVDVLTRCDGHADCLDKSDEDQCDKNTCNPNYWQCDNGQCVPIESRCDNGTSGLPSCRDGSDERNCTNANTCNSLMEKCDGGYCAKKQEFGCRTGVNGYTTIYPQCESDTDDCRCENELFSCLNTLECVGYGDRCNGFIDCRDGSDEENCENSTCPSPMFRCNSGQCLPWYKSRCDGIMHTILDCLDGSDEDRCPVNICPSGYFRCKTGQCMEFDPCSSNQRNTYQCDSKTDSRSHCGTDRCPEGYFRCGDGRCLHHISRCDNITQCQDGSDEVNCGQPECNEFQIDCGNGNCLPGVLGCDGFKDCPNGLDEEGCHYNATDNCMNGYVCLNSGKCINRSEVCSGISECPNSEDERFCVAACPPGCECIKGLINCDGQSISQTSDVWPFDRVQMAGNSSGMLKLSSSYGLSMATCRLTSVPTKLFVYVPFVQIINLRNNKITKVLQGDFRGLYRLSILDLSSNQIETIESQAFRGLRIFSLNLENNIIKNFDSSVFGGLAIDGELRSISYSFCCVKPNHLPEEHCYPKRDLFSSCDDLMKDETFRLLLWTIGLLAILGNLASLLLRCCSRAQSMKVSHEIFITNLCFADTLMGLYLLIIAVADELLRGKYVTFDIRWRNSAWCNIAGILSMVSSVVSALFISLITVDRFILVKYPFGNIRINQRAAIVVSGLIWVFTLILATFPLLITSYFEDKFYSKSSVCIAQPLTIESLSGWEYSVTIYLGLNFVLFLWIGIGQFMIYYEIVSVRRKAIRTSHSHDEIKVARKLMMIAVTDFFCWIPIGCLCIIALAGVPISPEVETWVIIFVLPINSALNPFLYTIMNKLC